jgi:toxin CptA
MMGAAAVIIPGGNDGLLLSGMPALAPHAWVGFLSMLISMLLLLALMPNDKGFSIGRKY